MRQENGILSKMSIRKMTWARLQSEVFQISCNELSKPDNIARLAEECVQGHTHRGEDSRLPHIIHHSIHQEGPSGLFNAQLDNLIRDALCASMCVSIFIH